MVTVLALESSSTSMDVALASCGWRGEIPIRTRKRTNGHHRAVRQHFAWRNVCSQDATLGAIPKHHRLKPTALCSAYLAHGQASAELSRGVLSFSETAYLKGRFR